MANNDIAAELIELLGLDRAPIGLTFVDEAPADESIEVFDEAVPSACSLWRRAESETFYVSAEGHFECPVGAMTMGFKLSPDAMESLGQCVDLMTSADYLEGAEAAQLPTVAGEPAGIVYGPLASLPIEPDVVLLWLTARSAMLFAEAGGETRWNESGSTKVHGRPGCASIPLALENQNSLSLGCAGMRTFTEIGDGYLAGVFARDSAESTLENLRAVVQSNASMQDYYGGRKAEFQTS